ncbi:hypothetical protein MTR_4g085740 [Medicago truncatula]|uniref:Uncharacterized protein n=1 Tax=Medicago truncatula TaxID=3880 RepID=G7JK29_MEDTR|nr:hypothetical protein MTR_4g085740 [Medicago truncatula]
MDIQSETINGILKKCLSLEKSNGFDVLKIKNPNLKFSELKWLIVEEIDIYIEGLQVVEIDSLIYPEKGLKMYSQNLNTFSSSYDPIVQSIYSSGKSLKTHEILENCSALFIFGDSCLRPCSMALNCYMLKATFNKWKCSNGVLNDDVKEKDVEWENGGPN